jgi:preprotein translocase subunit SecE
MSDHAPAEVRRKRVSPFRFVQEVREETRKVTWPSRKETLITTAMVFVMVAIASIFFLIADQVIRVVVTFVLGLGS